LPRKHSGAMVLSSRSTDFLEMSTTHTTSLTLDSKVEERVQRIASARRQSPDAIMREAIEQYVEREEKGERFREEALAAWTNYEATGLHVTAKEADAWLAALENGDDEPAPECHV
jgi:predicted transcriptional regulator